MTFNGTPTGLQVITVYRSEIYAFTNTVVWLEYESIQADIRSHICGLSKSLVCDFISANRQ